MNSDGALSVAAFALVGGSVALVARYLTLHAEELASHKACHLWMAAPSHRDFDRSWRGNAGPPKPSDRVLHRCREHWTKVAGVTKTWRHPLDDQQEGNTRRLPAAHRLLLLVESCIPDGSSWPTSWAASFDFRISSAFRAERWADFLGCICPFVVSEPNRRGQLGTPVPDTTRTCLAYSRVEDSFPQRPPNKFGHSALSATAHMVLSRAASV